MKTYLVGGAVRDKLLGYPYHERDWVVVGAIPEDLLSQGYQPVGKDFPVFLHPATKEEYALARTERKTGPGYRGFECFSSPDVTLEQDLQRRDLTINAIAEDNDGNIIDPYNGQQDLQQKLLRHVSIAFTEDPLRVLRVARFSARYAHLGFRIADETLKLMQSIAKSGELNALVAERVWKELERALTEKNPSQFFFTLDQADALAELIPEFYPNQEKLTPSTLDILDEAANNSQSTTQRFALLFIDLNKNDCLKICQRIKAPNDFRDLALLISQYAENFRQLANTGNPTTAAPALALLQQCDAFRRPERFEDFLSCCELLFKQATTATFLRAALINCNTIDAAKLAAQGLKGKAIAAALQQQRIETISQQIKREQL